MTSFDNKAEKSGEPLKDSVVYPTDKGCSYALSNQNSSLFGDVVNIIGQAWARDASGKSVSTKYSVAEASSSKV